MKRIIKMMSVVCGVLFFVFFISSKNMKLSAYASDDNFLEVKAMYLTASVAAEYNSSSNTDRGDTTICEGDYIVTLRISENTGFAATGFRINYNPNYCRPLYYDENSLVWAKENVLIEDSLTITPSWNNGVGNHYILGFGSMGKENAVSDGNILSFFVRPCRNGNDLTNGNRLSVYEEKHLITGYSVESWMDKDCHSVQHTVSNYFTVYHYDEVTEAYYGDIDNDGYITASDPQLLLQIVTVNDFSIDMNDCFIVYQIDGYSDVQGYYLIAVGDVNGDGAINIADAQDLLTYYSLYVAGNISGYSGIIGTETHTYVPYTISLS